MLAAADADSYLHLLVVNGITDSAIGLKAAVGHVAGLWCGFLPVGGDPPQRTRDRALLLNRVVRPGYSRQ